MSRRSDEIKVWGFVIFAIISSIVSGCDSKEEKHSNTPPEPIDGRSSYWYDDSETRRQKADATLDKYYERDENGNLVKRKNNTNNYRYKYNRSSSR